VAIFTRGLIWTAEELEILLVDVRKEMSIPGYIHMSRVRDTDASHQNYDKN
jgi:hypothetical protein